MDTERPLRVPVGRDAERWRTFPGERTLVVAARTVVSTTRVLECLPAVLPLAGTASLRVDDRPGEDFVLRVRASEGATGRG
ncbi:hypothetical protein ACFUGD_13850 [Streptomyces sp. NPDC057217]|uniref:hypothetical protein n=1 Tax=unclassified Streptomyces TaxID=2593676 RepID=UPI003631DB79